MDENNISPIGHSWDEVEAEIFTVEEITASHLRVTAVVMELAGGNPHSSLRLKLSSHH